MGGVSDNVPGLFHGNFYGNAVFLYWCTCVPLLSVPVVSESLPCTPISHGSSHRPGNSEQI